MGLTGVHSTVLDKPRPISHAGGSFFNLFINFLAFPCIFFGLGSVTKFMGSMFIITEFSNKSSDVTVFQRLYVTLFIRSNIRNKVYTLHFLFVTKFICNKKTNKIFNYQVYT